MLSRTPGTSPLWYVELLDRSSSPGALSLGKAVRLSIKLDSGCRLYVTGPAVNCKAACKSTNAAACGGDGDSSLEPLLQGAAAARQAWILAVLPGEAGISLISKVRSRVGLCVWEEGDPPHTEGW